LGGLFYGKKSEGGNKLVGCSRRVRIIGVDIRLADREKFGLRMIADGLLYTWK